MVRLAIIGHNEEDKKYIEENVVKLSHKIVKEKPELVISYGGDGSFLYAEHNYPHVPKIITRNKSICNLCIENLSLKNMLEQYTAKEYSIIAVPYLEITIKRHTGKKEKIFAVSDVTIRNKDQFHAIRFDIKTNEEKHEHIIGDGIVSANKLGIRGYFYSITKKDIRNESDFSKNIATAINNATSSKREYFISNEVWFNLKRNEASLTVDNLKRVINLYENDQVYIRLSKKCSRIITFEEEI